ncbi:flagellar protein FlaG [Lysinibacillus sp. KU-BSD001]|uniref:flagellar protein FlaG n=1 Tax=Lysinibacillus sp. KU-BSD001 TaxID=3141328 RepID=UPI0036E1F80B
MDVDLQRMDAPLNTGQTLVAQHKPVDTSKKTSNAQLQEKSRTTESSGKNNGSEKKEYTKEQLENAVESINEFLQTEQKDSKFVFHEGLNRYFVRLVDSKTEEVIKEIPPERLLNAFYEMQKLVGMIVDEKI